ncbi:transcriptional regulator [Intrasporangium chromatireducens Q5-1]|uniref:Transcriptional regulator n=1 Tax=Intrasporangium chromatireducens Q5-1 TaxID=584657 RepID=W9GCN1_9MICO|nr:helix-turn-helix transcriptional regulator [Intrasporangium chromatireducens]EWT03840.1 transcriptional regulator [Intrasporangium chromatireducens Q5-1]
MILHLGDQVARAREQAGLSQRALAERAGITQPTLSRIESGAREPKTNEVLAIAWATGSSVTEITGRSDVRARVRCVARATGDATMQAMHRELMHYLEVDAFLDEMGLTESA